MLTPAQLIVFVVDNIRPLADVTTVAAGRLACMRDPRRRIGGVKANNLASSGNGVSC
jgi:hypothetical protein